MIAARRLSAVAGLWLAVAGAVACPHPAAAATPAASCQGVTVTVEFNQLGGGERSACVDHGGTAADLFADAGFRLAYQPGMPDFVCTVQGLPDDRPCTSGSSYWSLWWSPGDHGWTYASLGVKSLDVAKGDSLAFTWHQGSAKAEPPSLAVGARASSSATTSPPAAADGSSTTTWLAIGAGVLAVAAAAAVPLLRRRKAG